MYRVVDWDKHFENNRTRELKKLDWIPFPNRHDGDGYTELLDHDDGAAHYGAWCAIVQVASKCDPRGTLSRDGARPHDARSLARMTRIEEGIMTVALDRLVHEVKWLEIVADPPMQHPNGKEVTEIPHVVVTIPHLPAEKRLWKGREGKGMEGKRKTGVFVSPSVEEVAAYCQERANGIDAQDWWDFWQARGWRMRSGLMKDWKAAVRNYEKSEFNKSKKPKVVTAADMLDYDPSGDGT